MIKTCGIFVFNQDQKILICHPTNAPYTQWSIPKGIPNDGESEWDAAKRELYEETGINLDLVGHKNIKKLGSCIYKNNKKILIVFSLELTDFIENLDCISMVGCKIPFKEVDLFRWDTIENSLKLIHDTQKKLLENYVR